MENEKLNDEREPSRTAAEAGWHASRYNVVAKVPGSNAVAIYNTYRRTCAEYTPIEAYLLTVLGELDEHHPVIERFARRGVISDFDEREAYVAQRRLDSATPFGGSVHVTICPTLACNFECPYCFATRGRGKMAAEVQDDVAGLVGRMLDASGARKLTITWFGGEPLLATDVIEALSPRLMAAAEERGCAYEAWVFTNGYLITPEVVELLERCGISHVCAASPSSPTEPPARGTRRTCLPRRRGPTCSAGSSTPVLPTPATRATSACGGATLSFSVRVGWM